MDNVQVAHSNIPHAIQSSMCMIYVPTALAQSHQQNIHTVDNGINVNKEQKTVNKSIFKQIILLYLSQL